MKLGPLKTGRGGRTIGIFSRRWIFYLYRPYALSGPNSGWGFYLTFPWFGAYKHIRAFLYSKGLSHRDNNRGTRSFEIAHWICRRPHNKERLTYKAFIRFKIGLGGPHPGMER